MKQRGSWRQNNLVQEALSGVSPATVSLFSYLIIIIYYYFSLMDAGQSKIPKKNPETSFRLLFFCFFFRCFFGPGAKLLP